MSWPICYKECGCYQRGVNDALRPARKEAAIMKWINTRCYRPCKQIECYCLKPKGHDGEHSPEYQNDNEADDL